MQSISSVVKIIAKSTQLNIGGMQMDCPNCKSQRVRKKEMIYEQGTSFSGNLSPIAMRAAPPRSTASSAPSSDERQGCSIVGFIVGVIIGFLIASFFHLPIFGNGAFITLIAGIIVAALAYVVGGESKEAAWERKQAQEKDSVAYQNWQKQWMCLDCGHEFIP
jgi:hypothetical protein